MIDAAIGRKGMKHSKKNHKKKKKTHKQFFIPCTQVVQGLLAHPQMAHPEKAAGIILHRDGQAAFSLPSY